MSGPISNKSKEEKKRKQAEGRAREADTRRSAPRGFGAGILALQDAAGNRTVTELLQTKPNLNQSGDPAEQDADPVTATPTGHSVSASRRAGRFTPRAIGSNHVILRKIESGQLKVNQPGNKYEREADRFAKRILQVSYTALGKDSIPNTESGQFTPVPWLDAEEIIPIASSSARNDFTLIGSPEFVALQRAIGIIHQVPTPTSSLLLRPSLGNGKSPVTIHTGRDGDNVAKALRAKAVTYHNHIYFADDEFRPGTRYGRELLAHELAHVIQQTGGHASWNLSPLFGAKIQRSPDSLESIFDDIDRIVSWKGGIYDERERAVTTLVLQIVEEEEEETPLLEQLMLTGVISAVGVATGGIGAFLIRSLTSSTVARIAGELFTTFATNQVTTLIEDNWQKKKQAGASPSAARFFELQVEAINDEAQKIGDELDDKEPAFRAVSDGVEQALKLKAALQTMRDRAFQLQFAASLAEWARLVDLSDRVEFPIEEFVEEAGVLGLTAAGTTRPSADFKIQSAHLEDVPKESRERLGGLTEATIGDLMGATIGAGLLVRLSARVSSSVGTATLELQSEPGSRGDIDFPISGVGFAFLFERGRQKYGTGGEGERARLGRTGRNVAAVTANLIFTQELSKVKLQDLPEIHG